MPSAPFRSVSLRLLPVAATALLAGCAWGPFQVDRSARAPELAGFGSSNMQIGAASVEARRWFAQGMAQTYAFNEVEAVRAFKAGLAQDPSCAMCAWGVAYQLGPNINHTERGDLGEALRYLDLAMRERERQAPRDRALIESLALRYAHTSEARNTAVLTAAVCRTGSGSDAPDPLDIAYAERMREIADRFPDDPDVLSIYVEAEMIATPGDRFWNAQTGQPAGRMGEVANRLEAALSRHPEHIGLNHYMVHAVDALPVAARAQAAADRLGSLAPASPHLLHMPGHTYLHLGRYADASRVNQQALAADDAQDAELARQGFKTTADWRGHNGSFLWYAELMEGRGDLALQTARTSAQRARGDNPFAEFARSRPLLTLLRLERWDDVLREPLPTGDKRVAALLGLYARGVALARTGQQKQATEALARLEPIAASVIAEGAANDFVGKMLRGLAQTSRARLRAELASGEGRIEVALAEQTSAIASARDLDDAEPPMIGADNRLALGDMQLRAGRWVEAEQSFRADLAQHPRSGWALRGLTRAIESQQRAERQGELAALRTELAAAWRLADAGLTAAR